MPSGSPSWAAKRPTPDRQKDFGGSGVLEIVEDYDTDTYRAIYTVRFERAIYVLHVFQKKSKQGRKITARDLDMIKSRLKRAEEREGHEKD